MVARVIRTSLSKMPFWLRGALMVQCSPPAPVTNPPPGLIIDHAFWMKKEGYKPSTIERRAKILKVISRKADLKDAEAGQDNNRRDGLVRRNQRTRMRRLRTSGPVTRIHVRKTKVRACREATVHSTGIRDRRTHHGNRTQDICSSTTIEGDRSPNRRSVDSQVDRY